MANITVHILGPDKPPYTEEWDSGFISKQEYDRLKDEQGHLYVLWVTTDGVLDSELMPKATWEKARFNMGFG